MPNEDNTQQMSNSNSQVIAAIRSLEDRVANVEQIIVARLNDTRPFEQQMLAQLNELVAGQARLQEQMGAMREELTAFREDFEKFRAETNHNFRLVNQKLEHLNNDFLNIRAEHALLEKRVSRLEEQAA